LLSVGGLRIGPEASGDRIKDVAAGLGTNLNQLPPVIDQNTQVLLRELSLGEDQFFEGLGIDDAFGRKATKGSVKRAFDVKRSNARV